MASLRVRVLVIGLLIPCLGFPGVPRNEPAGRVSDPGGRPLAGVAVSATGPDGVTVTVLTDREGTFTFAAMPAERYRVEATLPGFHTVTRDSVPLGAGATLRPGADDVGHV